MSEPTRDQIINRMVVAESMSRQYRDKPMDLDRAVKAVEGAQKLLGHVAAKLRDCPPGKPQKEPIRLLALSLQAMQEAHQELVLAYVLSGQASDDMLASLRDQFGGDPNA